MDLWVEHSFLYAFQRFLGEQGHILLGDLAKWSK